MKKLLILALTILFLTPVSLLANPPMGKGMGHSYHNKAAVVTTSKTPPGLARKGMTPHGLAKQNKTPAGWSQGQKEGWSRSFWDDIFGR